MKIAIIHDTRKIRTGAHHINDLIVSKLRQKGVKVREFYPQVELIEAPHKMKGLVNILFFFSLLEHKDEIFKCDLIQGTTYTPLTYLAFPIPVVCHFGSTTYGFLEKTPRAHGLNKETKKIFYKFRKDRVIRTLNIKSWKSLRDVVDIEQYVAKRAEGVIATSEIVKENLVNQGIKANKIDVIHNALEDYWFERKKKN